MAGSSSRIEVYVETGKRRTFAGALAWPGWCRSGHDEASALQALGDYGPRYARVLQAAQIDFQAPADASGFAIVERVPGTSTTDFGVPDAVPPSDTRVLDDVELALLKRLLGAYWQALDAAARAATGKQLRTGPRGGGRDLDGIVQHVIGAEQAYLRRLGRKLDPGLANDRSTEHDRTRAAVLHALTGAAHGDVPARGPRGGAIWPPRYFVRRVAWHVLDHTWELEDRAA